jgi:hypothetical protein
VLKTIGIVEVAAFAASVQGGAKAATTSTSRTINYTDLIRE